MLIKSGTNPYIMIGSSAEDHYTPGAGLIYIGMYDNDKPTIAAYNIDGSRYFRWMGSTLEIQSDYFTLNAAGSITATAGTIAGWNIYTNSIHKNSDSGIVSLASSASYWNLIDNVGALNYNQGSELLTSITNSYTGSAPNYGPDNWIKSGFKCDTFKMDGGYGVIKYKRPSVEFGL